MKRTSLIATLLIAGATAFLTPSLQAQTAPNGALLAQQSQVDAFAAFAYSEVTGTLHLTYSNSDPITNLDALSSLTAVGGLIIEGQTHLANLDGLNSLTTVRGQFSIRNNPELTNVDGLESLASVGDFLMFGDNPKLESLDGLRSLTSVGSVLHIVNNPLLTEFCGLYALLDAGGLVGTYTVSGNGANPTAEDIIAAGPCLTFDVFLGELVEEGVLNEGQVHAMEKLAEKNLKAFANHLNALVRNGTLSEDEAFLILFLFGAE